MNLAPLSRCTFLVADENRHMRQIVKNVLHSHGVRKIVEADDGADGFKAMNAVIPDMVITGWEMQPLDGIDFVKLVRNGKDSPCPLVPILLLTEKTEFRHITMARDAGVNNVIAKPVSSEILMEKILGALVRPKPFIRTHGYFGPDRRHDHHRKIYHGPDRRLSECARIAVESPFSAFDEASPVGRAGFGGPIRLGGGLVELFP